MTAPVRVYFRLAFGLTWGIGGVALLISHFVPGAQPLSPSSPLYYLAGYSVSVAGIILTARYKGSVGLRRLLRRVTPGRLAPYWCLSVIAVFAAMTALAWHAATYMCLPRKAHVELLVFLAALLPSLAWDPGPLGEEFGWRGFALPRLLESHSPLRSACILGVMHTLWHLPLFFISGMPHRQLSLPMFAIGVLAMAIFDTLLVLAEGGLIQTAGFTRSADTLRTPLHIGRRLFITVQHSVQRGA